MLAGFHDKIFALGIILTVACTSIYAQESVYKWVDKDGVVHFSDAPPDDSEAIEIEIPTTTQSPSYVHPAQTSIKSPSGSETVAQTRSTKQRTQIPPLVEEIDISQMSLADLDRRCEDTREKMIAPLREAEIVKCKETEDTDPAMCDRYWADYGDGGRSVHGTHPRLFHDLPECVEAWEERNRRGK